MRPDADPVDLFSQIILGADTSDTNNGIVFAVPVRSHAVVDAELSAGVRIAVVMPLINPGFQTDLLLRILSSVVPGDQPDLLPKEPLIKSLRGIE